MYLLHACEGQEIPQLDFLFSILGHFKNLTFGANH